MSEEFTSYTEAMEFMSDIIHRLETNQVYIDDLERITQKFARAKAFCEQRLSAISSGLNDTLNQEPTNTPVAPESVQEKEVGVSGSSIPDGFKRTSPAMYVEPGQGDE